MAKAKILCTGTCGFIFSNFVRQVLKDRLPYEVVGVDRVSRPEDLHKIYAYRSSGFYLADISDHHTMDRIFEFEKPDIVINGAAASHVDDSIADPLPFIDSNIKGTQVLVDNSLKHKVSRFVQISTDEVFGHLTDENESPWTETSLLNPRNPYAASKASAEMIVKAAHQTHGLPYNITRSCNNLGPQQSPKNLVPKVILNVLDNKEIPIYGDGKQLREWIHVVDNCYAILTILQNAPINETYNISTGYETTNLELIQDICNLMGKGHELMSFVSDRPGHDFRYRMSSQKLRDLGWKPMFSFKDALRHTIKWYTKNQYQFRG